MAGRPDVVLPGLSDLDPVHRGGFARVYRAYDDAHGRIVAVKVLAEVLSSDVDRRQFLDEVSILGRLSSHPGVVTLYRYGVSDDGHAFLVMEHCDGGSLFERSRHAPMDALDVARTLAEVASALSFGHSRGVIHCDVKPQNILLDRWGAPRLADYGVSVLSLGGGHAARGSTLAYAAPEQIVGDAVDERSDLYAFGSTMFHLLAGSPPFDDSSDIPTLVAEKTARGAPWLSDVDGRLAGLVAGLLRPEPSERVPTSAAALAVELSSLSEQLGSSEPTPSQPRKQPTVEPTVRRHGEPEDRQAQVAPPSDPPWPASSDPQLTPELDAELGSHPIDPAPRPRSGAVGLWVAVLAALALGGAGVVWLAGLDRDARTGVPNEALTDPDLLSLESGPEGSLEVEFVEQGVVRLSWEPDPEGTEVFVEAVEYEAGSDRVVMSGGVDADGAVTAEPSDVRVHEAGAGTAVVRVDPARLTCLRPAPVDGSVEPSSPAVCVPLAPPAPPALVGVSELPGGQVRVEWRDRSFDEAWFVVVVETEAGTSQDRASTTGATVDLEGAGCVSVRAVNARTDSSGAPRRTTDEPPAWDQRCVG